MKQDYITLILSRYGGDDREGLLSMLNEFAEIIEHEFKNTIDEKAAFSYRESKKINFKPQDLQMKIKKLMDDNKPLYSKVMQLIEFSRLEERWINLWVIPDELIETFMIIANDSKTIKFSDDGKMFYVEKGVFNYTDLE